MTQEYRIPKVESDLICFGDFTLPAHRVVRYNNNVIIEEDKGCYFRWEFTDKNYPSPRWQCVSFSPQWITLL